MTMVQNMFSHIDLFNLICTPLNSNGGYNNMITKEQKKKMYNNYKILLDRLEEQASKGNVKESEYFKIDILYRISLLIDML